MWTAEALAAPNLTAVTAEPEAPIDPDDLHGANTKASSRARPAPSSKFGPCGPWLGPATYSPHIPDPKDKRLGLDPIPIGVTYGAKSEFYQPKPSFFNILYTHPKFGASAYLALQRGALVRRRLHCLRLTRVGTLCLLLCRRSAAVG